MAKKPGELENQIPARQEIHQVLAETEFGVPKPERGSPRKIQSPEGQGEEVSETTAQDLGNLSEAVGESVVPSSGAAIASGTESGEVTEAEIAEMIHSGKPIENPAGFLERLINPDSKK